MFSQIHEKLTFKKILSVAVEIVAQSELNKCMFVPEACVGSEFRKKPFCGGTSI